MLKILFVILIVLSIVAALFESAFGLEQDTACYAALAIVGGGISGILGFYLFTAKGRAIVRTWNIQELRKKRIAREFHEAWNRNNRNSSRRHKRKRSGRVYGYSNVDSNISGYYCSDFDDDCSDFCVWDDGYEDCDMNDDGNGCDDCNSDGNGDGGIF